MTNQVALHLLSLPAQDCYDNDLFQSVIKAFIDGGYGDETFLAERLAMSIPSIVRWKNGTSQPHPSMRPSIYEALKEVIEAWVQ